MLRSARARAGPPGRVRCRRGRAPRPRVSAWSRDGGHVVDERAVRVVADGADHRQPQQRDGAAQRLVAERPQVGEAAAAPADDGHVNRRHRGEVAQRRRDRARRAAVLHRSVRPHDRPAPAAALEPCQQVGAGRAAARSHDADRARDRRAGQRLLVREQAVGLEHPAQCCQPGQQVAFAGQAQIRGAEAEARRRRSRAGIEIGAAGDDHLRAVAQRIIPQPELIEV